MEYDPAIGEAICEQIALGQALTRICQQKDMPSMPTVYKWLGSVASFATDYARAREDQAEDGYSRLLEIEQRVIDGDLEPNAARVAIDAIKWRLGKLKPKTYGDRLTLAGDDEAPLHLSVSRAVATLSADDRAEIERRLSRSGEQVLPKPEADFTE